MNCFIIFPEEFISSDHARLAGSRAAHARHAHALAPGIRIRAACYGGKRGYATILNVTETEINVQLELREEPLPRTLQVWIIAVARPQSTKKILHLAACLGVKEVHFVRAEQSVKSYLQSPIFEEQSLQAETLKGLEQSGDSVPPTVQVHSRFLHFAEDSLPSILKHHEAGGPALRVLAHTRAQGACPKPLPLQNCVMAIGPEAGWNEFEAQKFQDQAFTPVTLGSRHLRVDTAAVVLSAQLEALRSGNKTVV